MAQAGGRGAGPGPPESECSTISMPLKHALGDSAFGPKLKVQFEAIVRALSFLNVCVSRIVQALVLDAVERDDALPCRTFEQVVHATFNALAQDAGADFRPREGNVVFAGVQPRVRRLAAQLGIFPRAIEDKCLNVLKDAGLTYGALSNPRSFLAQGMTRDLVACVKKQAGRLLFQLLSYAGGLRWTPGRRWQPEEEERAKTARALARAWVECIKQDRADEIPDEVRGLYLQVTGKDVGDNVLGLIVDDPLDHDSLSVVVKTATWLKQQGATVKSLFPVPTGLVHVRFDQQGVVDAFPFIKEAVKSRMGSSKSKKKLKTAIFSAMFPGAREPITARTTSFTSNGYVASFAKTAGGKALSKHRRGKQGPPPKPVFLDDLDQERRTELAGLNAVVVDPNLDAVAYCALVDSDKRMQLNRATMLRARGTRKRQHAIQRARGDTQVSFRGELMSVHQVDQHRHSGRIGSCVDMHELAALVSEDMDALTTTWEFDADTRWREAAWRSEQGEERVLDAWFKAFNRLMGRPGETVVYLGKGSVLLLHSTTDARVQGETQDSSTNGTSAEPRFCAKSSSSTATSSS